MLLNDNSLVICGARTPVLRSVLTFVLRGNPVAVLVDDGTPDSVNRGLIQLLERIDAGHPSLPMIQFVTTGNCGAWLKELLPDTITASSIYEICASCLTASYPIPTRRDLQIAAHAVAKRCYVMSTIANQTHRMAARAVWENAFDLSCCNRSPLRLNFVLIDDNDTFRDKFAKRLKPFADVWAYPDIGAYLKIQGVDGPAIGSVEVFLLDIVDKRSDVTLAGIEKALPTLRIKRGLRAWPLVVMLSNLPNEMVGHLCCHAGADYYIEKTTLAVEPDLKTYFAKLLYHNTYAPSYLENCALKSNNDKIGIGWSGWGLLPGGKRLKHIPGIAFGLLNREHAVSRIDLERVFGDAGLSSATTLLVQPWADGARSPMASRIVKIDGIDQVTAEASAFHKYVNPAITQSFARIEPWFYRKDQWAALAYCLAGTRTALANNHLKSIYDKIGDEQCETNMLIKSLFKTVLKPLHEYTSGTADMLSFMARELEAVPVHDPVTFFRSNACQYEITRIRYDEAGSVSRIEFVECETSENKPQFPCFCIALPPGMPSWLLRPGKQFNGGAIVCDNPLRNDRQTAQVD